MEDNVKLLEKLIERVVEYIKTSYKLLKLKALERGSDVSSTMALHAVVFMLIASFILFFNLGLALWVGDMIGKPYIGFFLIGGLYLIIAIAISLFMGKWIKKWIRNYIIKHLLK